LLCLGGLSFVSLTNVSRFDSLPLVQARLTIMAAAALKERQPLEMTEKENSYVSCPPI